MRMFEYLNCNVKNNTEGLQGELIHGIDPVKIVEDEVKKRSPCRRTSIELPRLKRKSCDKPQVEKNHLVNLAGSLL